MQIGSSSPFSKPSALADALRLNPNQTQEKDPSASKAEGQNDKNDSSVEEKDPIDALKEQLAQENEPTAMDKLRSKIAQNGLSRLVNLVKNIQSNKQQETSPLLKLPKPQEKPQEEAKKEETQETPKEEAKEPSKETKPAQKPQNNSGLQISDLNLIPMKNFNASTAISYEATYNQETGVATQEMAYTQSFSFTFSGTVTDQNGKKYNIEANVTLTHSLYTKITGGSDTLDPKVLEKLKNGEPFDFDYEGDGKDLKDQDFGFLFDDSGKSDQISSNRGIFGDLVDRAFNEGLGSLLEGLQVFALGAFGDKPTTLPAHPQDTQNTNQSQGSLDLFDRNKHLIGLGEQGVGMIFLSQMQRDIFIYSSNGSSGFSASFSYQSTKLLFASDKGNHTLESILEQQKKKKEEQQQNATQTDVKKALHAYKGGQI